MGGAGVGTGKVNSTGYRVRGGRGSLRGLVCIGQPIGSKNSEQYPGVEGGYHEDTVF